MDEIKTILVHVDIDAHSPDFLNAVGALAKRFDSRIIAHAAASPATGYLGLDGGVLSAELYAQERAEIEERLLAIEKDFRAAMPSRLEVEWLSVCWPPNLSINDHVFRADLVVAQSIHGKWEETAVRHLDLGDLVLAAGRPVLIVGSSTKELVADRIVVGWKDCREARRAVADALPFLRAASKVWVLSVDETGTAASRIAVEGVVAWLGSHGVRAEGKIDTRHRDAAAALSEFAVLEKADLIVTGGYGHTRLRELLFGGVTRHLLADSELTRLMSN